jgi:hypothetical protein
MSSFQSLVYERTVKLDVCWQLCDVYTLANYIELSYFLKCKTVFSFFWEIMIASMVCLHVIEGSGKGAFLFTGAP